MSKVQFFKGNLKENQRTQTNLLPQRTQDQKGTMFPGGPLPDLVGVNYLLVSFALT